MEIHVVLTNENLDRIKSIVNSIVKSSSDDGKLELELEIRKYVNAHRMHENAKWSVGEAVISGWENTLNSIKYSKEEYSYLYLFLLTDIQININPIQYNEKNWVDENIEQSKRIMEKEFKYFKNHELSIKVLIEKLSKVNNEAPSVGFKICKYYTGGEYNEDILNVLYDANYKWSSDYIENIIPYNREILKLIVDSDKYNDAFKVEVYKIDYRQSNSTPLIKNERSDELLKKFWNSDLGIKKDLLNWQIEQLICYDSTDSLVNSIYISIKNKFLDDKDSFKYFKNIISMSDIKDLHIAYELERILEHFESVFKNQDDILIDIARIELKYYSLLKDKKLNSLSLMLSKNANMYAELCSYVYKDDDGGRKDIGNETFSFYFDVYFNTQFKIGMNNNNVCEESLVKKWALDFKQALDKYNIGRLYDDLLGKVIGFNLLLQGFNYPLVNIIEEYGNDKLIRAIAIEHYNSYGARWVGDGSNWLIEKKKYLTIIDKIKSEGKLWTVKLLNMIVANCDEMYFQERDMLQGNA